MHTLTGPGIKSIKESLQATLCLRIGAVVVLIDDLLEDRLIRIGMREEGHRGAQFDRVNAAEDVLCGEPAMQGDDLGAFDQPWTKDGMRKVGLRFGKIVDRVRLGHRTAPETGQLREDEPHPMTGLASVAQLREGSLIRATAVLSLDETLEVHAAEVSVQLRPRRPE